MPELIFGYYGSWATYRSGKGRCTVEDIDPNSCTHLIYAFAKPTFSGGVEVEDNNLVEQFNNLRNRNRSLKTLIGIGGANVKPEIFSSIAANASLRRKFVENVHRFCQTHGFNGVDIDWEFPQPSDRNNFVLMLSDLSSVLGKHDLLLTVSVGPSEYRASKCQYDIPGIAEKVDYILLMAYDYNGNWDEYTGHNAPLYSGSSDSEFQKKLNIDHSVRYWKRQGAPSHKLILGLATFGRTFTLSNSSNNGFRAPAKKPDPKKNKGESGILAYYEIQDHFTEAETRWDNEQCVPYAVSEDQWVGFDNAKSIQLKCEYIQSQGLGGAMIWSIDKDERRGGAFTLLNTIKRCLQRNARK